MHMSTADFRSGGQNHNRSPIVGRKPSNEEVLARARRVIISAKAGTRFFAPYLPYGGLPNFGEYLVGSL